MDYGKGLDFKGLIFSFGSGKTVSFAFRTELHPKTKHSGLGLATHIPTRFSLAGSFLWAVHKLNNQDSLIHHN